MAMLGFDKLWNSIKGFFSGSTEKKEEDSTKKKVEE
jgi:hypothetical protein